MSDLNQYLASSSGSGGADPGRSYDEGEPATEPNPPKGDTDQPGDPAPRAGLRYDEGDPATEPPPPKGDQDQPGEPPSLQVAERNGR